MDHATAISVLKDGGNTVNLVCMGEGYGDRGMETEGGWEWVMEGVQRQGYGYGRMILICTDLLHGIIHA